jgi:oligopeptide/dipeptide ABC transporter ATP-binding protein
MESSDQINIPLVKVENLRKLYPLTGGLFKTSKSFIHAVDGISFNINFGESMGLVGESGSGKTTTGKLLVKLFDATEGHMYVNVNNEYCDLSTLRGARMKEFRQAVQMIFQDPYESLNPRLTIFDTIAEPLVVQGIGDVVYRENRVAEVLEMVNITPPSTYMFRFPHELSGGQRQRVAIARALVINPSFIVCDEPTSMLDVSIRTGVMNLMQDLAEKLGVTYLYITHDLAVARYMSAKLAVMYLGKIIEYGETEEVILHPLHPYTKALISAVPVPDPTYNRAVPNIIGSIAQPINPLPRCRFYERCPISEQVCIDNDHPPLANKGSGHLAACYLV